MGYTQQLSEAIVTRSLEALQRLIDDPQCDLNAPLGINDGDCNAAAAALHCVLRPPKDICGSEGPLWKDTSTQMIGMLLASGRCDVNVLDSHGRTPLHYAAIYRLPEVARLLIEDPKCDLNVADLPRGFTVLHYVAANRDMTIFKYLLAYAGGRCDVNVTATVTGETALHLIGNDVTAGQALIVTTAFTNYDAKASRGSATALRRLIRSRCSCQGPTLDVLLIESNKCDVTEVDEVGRTLLHDAARQGKCRVISALLASSSRASFVNTKDNYDFAPIHVCHTLDSLRLLAACPLCDVDIRGQCGLTLFETAIRNHNIPMVRFLLSCSRCNVHVKDHEGNTALHLACLRRGAITRSQKTATRMLSLLLESGRFDVNATNGSGQTPLMVLFGLYIPSQCVRRRVSLLIRYGADTEKEDSRGLTVAHYATWTVSTYYRPDQKYVYTLLLDAGADTTSANLFSALKFFEANNNNKVLAKLLRDEGVVEGPPRKKIALHNKLWAKLKPYCSVM